MEREILNYITAFTTRKKCDSCGRVRKVGTRFLRFKYEGWRGSYTRNICKECIVSSVKVM